MRTIFKTSYHQDIARTKDWRERIWYILLAALLLVLPLFLGTFWVGEIAYVFILCIISIGLMLLTGFTGQVSIGHGAFVGIGAYTEAILLTLGVPFGVSIIGATLLAAVIGILLGYPALRLSGLYLAIATLSFSFIVEHVFIHWESATGGYNGMMVPEGSAFGYTLTFGTPFYFLCLLGATAALLIAQNIMRSPTGRAFVSIRDSETAAQSMGVNLAAKKTLAFSISAGFAGFGGALLAHRISYLAPDAFGVLISIQFLLMIVVGGLGSFHGAIFLGVLPQAIAILRDELPPQLGQQPGLEPALFGLIIVLVVLFEPTGMAGRWEKMKVYCSQFPTYRKATFRTQKTYTKSERFR
ncbi:branched-chain amino acid ABC transporter permease [Martelella sp. FLE1502]